ncbi:MAG: cupin domain-containing protein [Pseudomonadota bacterium]
MSEMTPEASGGPVLAGHAAAVQAEPGTALTMAALAGDVMAYQSSERLEWVEAKPGVYVKTLFDGGPHRGRTLLFKLTPGARSAPHTHDVIEQIYVLEGDFHDGASWLRAGDMCVRPPGTVHSASTEQGAVALVIYAGSAIEQAGSPA